MTTLKDLQDMGQLAQCSTCFAAVPLSGLVRHSKWHVRQDEALGRLESAVGNLAARSLGIPTLRP